MDLVTPDIGLIFWTTVSFAILYFILAKFAWKPILGAVNEREKSIKDALSAAEMAKEEMASLKADNEKILNRDLAIDLSISTLIGSVVFTFIRFLSVSGNSNIMNLLIYLTIIALAFIVSLNVIKMKYIKVRKE